LPKRYVLFRADVDFTGERIELLQSVLDSRYGKVKLIMVKGNPRAVIVKTTNEVAPLLRNAEPPLELGGERIETVMTSGAVGNLKRRALGAKADGQVLE
jgi:hypothetical protein